MDARNTVSLKVSTRTSGGSEVDNIGWSIYIEYLGFVIVRLLYFIATDVLPATQQFFISKRGKQSTCSKLLLRLS